MSNDTANIESTSNPTSMMINKEDDRALLLLQQQHINDKKSRARERRRRNRLAKKEKKKPVSTTEAEDDKGTEKTCETTLNGDSDRKLCCDEGIESQQLSVSLTPQSRTGAFERVAPSTSMAMDIGSVKDQLIDRGTEVLSTSGSKRKGDARTDTFKKVKVSSSTSAEIVELETDATSISDKQEKKEHWLQRVLRQQGWPQKKDSAPMPFQPQQQLERQPEQQQRLQPCWRDDTNTPSIGNLPLQGPTVWSPEFFIGGNPEKGPLKADQSTFMDDVALGLVHGARLPADIAYFTQYRDASQLYTHIARCLSGVIGATAELHNRVVRSGPCMLEMEKLHSSLSKLENDQTRTHLELQATSMNTHKQAEKIANQTHCLNVLQLRQRQIKKNLEEKNEQFKLIDQKYNEECQKNKALYNEFHQLLRKKKDQEDAHAEEVACLEEQYEKKLAQEKRLAIQSSVRCTLRVLGLSFEEYQTRCKALLEANKSPLCWLPELGPNGDFVPLVDFVDLEYEEKGSDNDAEEKRGTSGVESEATRMEPVTKSQSQGDGAVVVTETLQEASQTMQHQPTVPEVEKDISLPTATVSMA
ncbi:hypothetical protein IFM89_035923 [Coptis chinensis]|uniref:Uncharacterized protein n=1 Tax=Coptis chinensis TaxID=261450 RepID=A0A835LDJ1_9MAGN|nr:hypothetical protein IFM89_035923 [Coptis chinensis]